MADKDAAQEWVWVPRIPTDAMLNAPDRPTLANCNEHHYARAWDAMLAAIPASPPPAARAGRLWSYDHDMPSQRSDGAGFGFDTWRKLVEEHNALVRAQTPAARAGAPRIATEAMIDAGLEASRNQPHGATMGDRFASRWTAIWDRWQQDAAPEAPLPGQSAEDK